MREIERKTHTHTLTLLSQKPSVFISSTAWGGISTSPVHAGKLPALSPDFILGVTTDVYSYA